MKKRRILSIVIGCIIILTGCSKTAQNMGEGAASGSMVSERENESVSKSGIQIDLDSQALDKTDSRTETSSYELHNPQKSANGDVTWDCIFFGNYYQKNDKNKEPIKWRVLSVNGDDAFLLADQNLDCQPYHTSAKDITWETCSLRTWLNSVFYQNAFSPAEQTSICTTTVVNEDNPSYGTEVRNNTQDKVYLLSISEASNEAYGFHSKFNEGSETRYSKNTEYAVAQGAVIDYRDDYVGNGLWWLRSPGRSDSNAAYVFSDGYANSDGDFVSSSAYGVRPALHLNLSSTSNWSYAGKVNGEEKHE